MEKRITKVNLKGKEVKEMKKVIFVLIMSVFMMAAAWEAQADYITLTTPDGTFNVSQFDWQVGNALSVGSVPAVVGDTSQLYYQAWLVGLKDENNAAISLPRLNYSGTDPNIIPYEITVMAAVLESVASVVPPAPFGAINLITIPGGANYVSVFLDTSVGAEDSNKDLTGVGFNDGTLILSGSALAFNLATGVGFTNFTLTSPVLQDLDQFGTTNSYPLIDSVKGVGSTNLDSSITYFDPLYVSLAGNALLSLQLYTETTNGTPFTLTDPSAKFMDISAANPGTNVTPSFFPAGDGTKINGGPRPGIDCGIAGKPPCPTAPIYDFQFQADAASTVKTVPEPGTLWLLGAGLLGLGGLSIRRRQRP